MKVYLLNRGKDLVCVCSSKEKALECAEDDAAMNLLFEKFGESEQFKGALNEYNHAYIHGVWYYIKDQKVL